MQNDHGLKPSKSNSRISSLSYVVGHLEYVIGYLERNSSDRRMRLSPWQEAQHCVSHTIIKQEDREGHHHQRTNQLIVHRR